MWLSRWYDEVKGHTWLAELDYIGNRHDHKYMVGTCCHAVTDSLTALFVFSVVIGPGWQPAVVKAARIVFLVVINLSGL